MDRYQASELFALLGDPDQLKITKMTYNHGCMDATALAEALGISLEETTLKINRLVSGGLLCREGEGYVAKLALIDDLMGFLFHRCGGSCGCSHQ